MATCPPSVRNISPGFASCAYTQEAAETRTYHDLDTGYRERNLSLARAQGIFKPLLSLLAGCGAIIALVVGDRGVIAGRVSTGGYVAFTIYLATLVWPMIALGWAISLLQRGDAATARIDALMAVAPHVADPAEPRSLPAGRHPA